MRTKYEIESDLIQVTASLADLAICGIGRNNIEMKNLARLTARILDEAANYTPTVVTMDGEPVRDRDRLLTGSDA